MYFLIYKVELTVNKILIILSLVLLASCGQSQEENRQVEMEQQRIEMERQRLEKVATEKLAQEKAARIAAITCSIISETRNWDAAVRVREMNEAREKIGGEPFLSGDNVIKRALKKGYCEGLVLNDTNAHPDMRPTVKEEFYSNGKLKSRRNFQSDVDGGRENGLYEEYYENGQLKSKGNHKDGKDVGLWMRYDRTGKDISNSSWETYYENGQLESKGNYKNGKRVGLMVRYYENGQLSYKGNFKDGDVDGLAEGYDENGQLAFKSNFPDGLFKWYDNKGQVSLESCYKNGETTDMSYCEK